MIVAIVRNDDLDDDDDDEDDDDDDDDDDAGGGGGGGGDGGGDCGGGGGGDGGGDCGGGGGDGGGDCGGGGGDGGGDCGGGGGGDCGGGGGGDCGGGGGGDGGESGHSDGGGRDNDNYYDGSNDADRKDDVPWKEASWFRAYSAESFVAGTGFHHAPSRISPVHAPCLRLHLAQGSGFHSREARQCEEITGVVRRDDLAFLPWQLGGIAMADHGGSWRTCMTFISLPF